MSRLLITVDTTIEAFRQNGWRREAAEVLYLLVARLTETRDCDDERLAPRHRRYGLRSMGLPAR